MSVCRRKKKRGGKRTLTLENDEVGENDGVVVDDDVVVGDGVVVNDEVLFLLGLLFLSTLLDSSLSQRANPGVG